MTEIATARLILRPPRDSDVAALVRGLNNFAVSQWTSRIPFPYGLVDAAEFLRQCASDDCHARRFAIIAGGGLIGVIGLELAADAASAEIGYWLAEPEWRKGYGREAARAVADHGFEALGLAAMTARYRIGNAASRLILLDLGFIEMGETRGVSRATGGETDSMCLSLSKADWATAKARRP